MIDWEGNEGLVEPGSLVGLPLQLCVCGWEGGGCGPTQSSTKYLRSPKIARANEKKKKKKSTKFHLVQSCIMHVNPSVGYKYCFLWSNCKRLQVKALENYSQCYTESYITKEETSKMLYKC